MTALPSPFLGAAVTAALGMLATAMLLVFIRLVRGPSLPDRVMALDLLSVLAVGMIAAFDILTAEPVFLDAATVVALISFLGTVALARYIELGARP